MNSVALLEQRLKASWSVKHLNIEDQSHLHRHPHAGVTHIKITLVSDDFIGTPFLQRHRQVQKKISDIQAQLHAISLELLTPDEYLAQKRMDSPTCRGGGRW